MEVLVVSKSFIIREAMGLFFNNYFENCKVNGCRGIKDILNLDLSSTEFLFVDVETDIIHNISEIKQFYRDLKVIVFNKINDKSILLNCLKNKIESCIFDIYDKDDLIHIVNTLRKGKKYYDVDLLEDIIHDESYSSDNGIELLTNRENEILDMVGLGNTNREIAKNLYISEHTVKKHITNILSKLDMRNRKDLIIYKSENNINIFKKV